MLVRSPLKDLSPNKVNGKDLVKGFSNSPDPKKPIHIRKSSYIVEFPIGSMGLELEPVITSKERKIGCRIRGFYFAKDHYGINRNELERKVSKGDIISTIQDKSVISSPFDDILSELMTLKSRTKSIGFKSVDPENTTPTKHRSNKSIHSETNHHNNNTNSNSNIKKERKSHRKIINTNSNNNNNNRTPTKSTLTPTKNKNEIIIRKEIDNTSKNIISNNNKNSNNRNNMNSNSNILEVESCLSPSKIKGHVRSSQYQYQSSLSKSIANDSVNMNNSNTSLNNSNIDVLINAMTMLEESTDIVIDNNNNSINHDVNTNLVSDINMNDMSMLSSVSVSNMRLVDDITTTGNTNIDIDNDGNLTPIKTNASYHYDSNDNHSIIDNNNNNNNNHHDNSNGNKLNNALSTIVYPLVGGVGKTLGVLGSVGAMGFNLTSKLLNGSDDDIDQVASVIPIHSNEAMTKAMNAKNALLQELSKSALQLGELEEEAKKLKNREKELKYRETELVDKVTLLEESNINISQQLKRTTEGTLALTEAGVEAIQEGEALQIELKERNDEVLVLRSELSRVEIELREATLRLMRKEYESKPIIAMAGTQTIQEVKEVKEEENKTTNTTIIDTTDIAINTDDTGKEEEEVKDVVVTEEVMVQTLRTMMQDDEEAEFHSSESKRLAKSVDEVREAKTTIKELQDEMSALLHLNKRMIQQNNDYKYSLSNIEEEKKNIESELNNMKIEIQTLREKNQELENVISITATSSTTTSATNTTINDDDEIVKKVDHDMLINEAVSFAVTEAINKCNSQHEIEMKQLHETIELMKSQHLQEINEKDEQLIISNTTSTTSESTITELNNTTSKLRHEMKLLSDNAIELIASKEKESQRAECYLKELELNKTLNNNEKQRFIAELNESGVANEVLRFTLSDMEININDIKRELELNISEMVRVCRERDTLIEEKSSKELLFVDEKNSLLNQIKEANSKLEEMNNNNKNLIIENKSSMNELLKVNTEQELLRKEMNDSLLIANQRLNEMEDDKSSYLLNKTKLNEECNNLKKELQLKTIEITTLNNTIQNQDEKSHLLELEVEKLTSLLDRNAHDRDNNTTQLDSLNNELNSVNHLYSESCITIDKLKESLSIAMEEGRRAQTTAEESLLNNNELKKEMKELSYKINEMSNIKQLLDSSENELENLRKLLKTKDDKINNLEDIEKQRTISFKKAETLWNKRATEIENDFKIKLKDQALSYNHTLEKLKSNIIDIKSERDLIKKNAKSAVSAFDKQIVSLQEEHMKSVENNRKDRNRLITAFEKRVKDLSNQLSIVTDNSRNKKKEVDILKNMIEKDSNVVSELSSQLTQTKKAFSILQNDEIKLKSICQQLDSKNHTLIDANKELRTNNIEKDQELESLTNELEKLKDRVFNMQELFNEENDSIDIIKSESEGYKNDASKLALRLKQSNDELYETKNHIRDIEKHYNIACNDIKSNKMIIETLKNEKDVLSSLLIAKRKEFDELHVRLTELLCGESFNVSFNDSTGGNSNRTSPATSPTTQMKINMKTKTNSGQSLKMNHVVILDDEDENENDEYESNSDEDSNEGIITAEDDNEIDDNDQDRSIASNFFDVSADSENLMVDK